MLCIALLTTLLTLGTFIQFTETLFVTFIITTGIALAACGSYLQTSVVAVASLFGPTVIQSMLSGQAIVAVILSSVQLISAIGSVHASKVAPTDGVAETKSARLFFGISASFLFVCGAAYAWMTRLPSFQAVVPPQNNEPWTRRRLSISADLSPVIDRSDADSVPDSKIMWDRIFIVARRNALYEIAVAYVFMITLVSFVVSSDSNMTNIICDNSLSFRPLQYRLFPPIPRYIHFFSLRFISSSSMSATGLGDTFAVSRACSYGVQGAFFYSRSRGHSLSLSSWRAIFIATLHRRQRHP